MKNIKELRLETIQLEDQVLLVDENQKINTGDFYIKNVLLRCTSTTDVMGVEDVCKKVICSTKPLEGLPLLVIEDEVETAYYEDNDSKIYGEDLISVYREGYEKTKLHYKFTEEDLRKAMHKCFEKTPDATDFDKIVASVSQKELWIEVVFNSKYGQRGSWTYGDYELANKNLSEFMVVKITDGKIKAIWK